MFRRVGRPHSQVADIYDLLVMSGFQLQRAVEMAFDAAEDQSRAGARGGEILCSLPVSDLPKRRRSWIGGCTLSLAGTALSSFDYTSLFSLLRRRVQGAARTRAQEDKRAAAAAAAAVSAVQLHAAGPPAARLGAAAAAPGAAGGAARGGRPQHIVQLQQAERAFVLGRAPGPAACALSLTVPGPPGYDRGGGQGTGTGARRGRQSRCLQLPEPIPISSWF